MTMKLAARPRRNSARLSISILGLFILAIPIQFDCGTLLPEIKVAAAKGGKSGKGSGHGAEADSHGRSHGGHAKGGGKGHAKGDYGADGYDRGRHGAGHDGAYRHGAFRHGAGRDGAGRDAAGRDDGTGGGEDYALRTREPVKFVVYFGFDKATLDAAARDILAEASAAARKLGGDVKVAGNADRAGPGKYNRDLSARRAQVVTKYLIGSGLTASKIRTNAHGETKPLARTADGVPDAFNRRVEIVIEPL